MADFDHIHSRPYNPKMACERCCFGSGEHARWCRKNIKTENMNPPIPGGPYWQAWVDGEVDYDCLTGLGSTEDAAVRDLQEQIFEGSIGGVASTSACPTSDAS